MILLLCAPGRSLARGLWSTPSEGLRYVPGFVERVNTDNSWTKMSIENTVRLHTEAKVGTSQFPPSASAELTTDTEFKHGYFRETSSNWTQNSIADSQEKYEAEVGSRTNVRYDNGMLWVAMKVTNNSDLSFKVKDLRVIAYRMLPNGSFSAVGMLTPGKKSTEGDAKQSKDTWVTESLCADPSDPATCGHVLGPGGEIVLVMGADSLPAQEMKALVRNPSALMFEVGSCTLFQMDEFGVKETVNYAVLGERAIQRTGILVIDYGDGTVERHVIATNTLSNADGSGKGLTLEEAIAVAGTTDYELCADGKTLCRVKNTAAFRCDPDYAGLPIALALCSSQALAGTSSITTTAEITVTANRHGNPSQGFLGHRRQRRRVRRRPQPGFQGGPPGEWGAHQPGVHAG